MTTLIGTANGVFVCQAAGACAPARGMGARGVRYLGRVDGQAFAGADDGLYRSEDGGRSWQPSGLSGRVVWDLQAAPGDGRTLYAVTEPAALFVSRDGGHAWVEVESFRRAPGAERWCVPLTPPQPGRARTLVIDRERPDRWLVGVEVGGVIATEDGGRSWTAALPGGNPDIHVMVSLPADPGVIFVSTGFGRIDQREPREGRIAGMFRSDDRGKTWRFLWQGVEPPYTRPLCIDPRPPHAVTVGSSPSAFSSIRDVGGARAVLHQSTDGGASWRSLGDAAHSPSPAIFHAVAPDSARAGAVVVGTETGEVWRVIPEAGWTLLARDLPMVQALLPMA